MWIIVYLHSALVMCLCITVSTFLKGLVLLQGFSLDQVKFKFKEFCAKGKQNTETILMDHSVCEVLSSIYTHLHTVTLVQCNLSDVCRGVMCEFVLNQTLEILKEIPSKIKLYNQGILNHF